MTVLITLTLAGTDTGPFNLYSNADGYVSAFETGVSKAALVAGYSSALVPNTATIIRVKSTGACQNYIDITLTGTTTTTTSITSTTTTTTTIFVCADCRNWEYNGATIPAEGDVIFYYRCSDGASQTIVLSNGDPTGNFCNCNTIGNPTSLNGTVLTEIGICSVTTTTTAIPPAYNYYTLTPCTGGVGTDYRSILPLALNAVYTFLAYPPTRACYQITSITAPVNTNDLPTLYGPLADCNDPNCQQL